MYQEFYFKILNKNIKLITNSIILKDLIMDSLPCRYIKNKNYSLSYFWILKKPYDFKESIFYFNRFITKLIYEVKDKYIILHGSAFSFKDKATVILGAPEKGKSSILLSSALLGTKIISDEPLLIEKKTNLILPFIYLIKIAQPKNKFFIDICKQNNSIIKFKNYEFIFFQKKLMERLGVSFENKKTPLKNIIFLEEKKYDPVIHLVRHSLNQNNKISELFKSMVDIIDKKNIRFITHPFFILKSKQKIKDFLDSL